MINFDNGTEEDKITHNLIEHLSQTIHKEY